jgi:hypothetical protein
MHKSFTFIIWKGMYHLEDRSVDGKIFEYRREGECPVANSCEHGNETSGSVRSEECLD